MDNTIFITGYAKLPTGITAAELTKVVGIALRVEPTTGKIVEADCTLATALGRRFLSSLLEGRSLDTDLDLIINDLETKYLGYAQKATIAAVKIIHEKYRAYQAKRPSQPQVL